MSVENQAEHQHRFDAQGRQICCSQEELIYRNANAAELLQGAPAKGADPDSDDHHHDHDHDHDHDDGREISPWRLYLPAVFSLFALLVGIALDSYFKPAFFNGYLRFAWYLAAYLPVGFPVLKQALIAFGKREYFTEFLLMGLATIGAFGIGEYPEAVAVMLFYTVGELFQSAAVNRAKGSIKALLEVRPTVAHVLRNGAFEDVNPESVSIGDTIQIKAGEKVPLDGVLVSARSSFNAAALTGESKPKLIVKDEIVLAGMLNLDSVVELKVTKAFADSALAKILELVQNATANKAPTELLIRRLARIYTPTVVALALALVVVPYFLVTPYVFYDWLYRALVFLVISCPCALVISIPLGYFGGIGAASRHGILFKGANYLERMTAINTVVMDKTGTLTEGVFAVQSVVLAPSASGRLQLDEAKFIALLAALESKSTHPIAKAVVAYAQQSKQAYEATDIEEISGHGLKGSVDGKSMLAGNTKLLKKFAVPYDAAIDNIVETIVVVALDGQFVGYILIADKIKADAQRAMDALRANGVRQLIMLSGDKHAITQKVAQQLGIDAAFGDLLPEQKVQKVEALKRDPSAVIAFVGDGINDAPVLASTTRRCWH